MAVTQLNYYSNSDVSIIDLMNTTDGTFIGRHQVSLTNYDNTSLPAIAIGSIVENNGSLFKFEDETAISGSPSDGTVYIYLVPSGDPSLGTATVTPTFTNTAPTWSDSKQGFYGTGGSANYRYLEFILLKTGASWDDKQKVENCKKTFERNKSIISYKTSGTQVLTANTSNTSLLLDTLISDDLLQYNTGTGVITLKESGLYEITLFLYGISTTTASTRQFTIKADAYKNSSTALAFSQSLFTKSITSSASSGFSQVLSLTDNLSATETLLFRASNTVKDLSGTDQAENITILNSNFIVKKLLS